MRLIDADAFAEFIKYAIKTQKYDFLKINDTTLTVDEVLECVVAELEGTGIDGFKNNPTIEPWKGKWVRANTHTDGIYECSACLQWTYIPFHPSTYNYCPRCGSDMRGDDDEI